MNGKFYDELFIGHLISIKKTSELFGGFFDEKFNIIILNYFFINIR